MSGSPSLSASTSAFGRFAFLPKELRDMIWEYAAISLYPSVHVFQLITDDQGGCRCMLDLSIGLDLENGLNDGNASSYELGVWEACCESRQVLDKLHMPRMNIENGPVFGSVGLPLGNHHSFGMLTGYTRQSDRGCGCSCGEHLSFVNPLEPAIPVLVNLEQDVICLNFELPSLKFRNDGEDILDIAELRSQDDSFPVRRIALQFSPHWSSEAPDGIGDGEEDTLCDLLDNFTSYARFPLLECVYFIDSRITAKSSFQVVGRVHDPDLEVFRNRGVSYCEIALDDDKWSLPDNGPFSLASELAEERSHRKNLFFADAADGLQSLNGIQSRATKWDLQIEQQCQFKVLACLPRISH